MTRGAKNNRAELVSPTFLRDVEMLSQMQAEASEIAATLELPEEDFLTLVRSHRSVRTAIRRGRVLGIIAIRKQLMKRCHTYARTCIMMSKKYLGQR